MFDIGLSSPPSHDELVADVVWVADGSSAQVAEIARLDGVLTLTLFPNPSGREWNFPVAEFNAAIEDATTRLRDRLQ